MKIKEKIITTMDQPEAMQEDGDNWNQEEMLQAAVGLIELDNDLQSSGNSTSTSPPESDSDCDNGRGLVSRPFVQEKYRFRSATKMFNALKFEEQCFNFKEYLRSPDTFRNYSYLSFTSGTNRTSGIKLSISHGMKTGRNCSMPIITNSMVVIIFSPVFLFYNWKCCNIPVHTLDTYFYFSGCMTKKTKHLCKTIFFFSFSQEYSCCGN